MGKRLSDLAQSEYVIRDMLRRLAILRPTVNQPIWLQPGKSAAYLFYPWNVTLSGAGLSLIARCLLERLKFFRGRQLANVGLAGAPLVSACVALGKGRYQGLFVREQRKAYGSLRRIEGPGNRRIPVILIDDTIGSGHSAMQAIAALEEEGFKVEGMLALVEYKDAGGRQKLESLGYRFTSVLEFTTDFSPPLPRTYAKGDYLPFMPASWGAERIPDGFHPAVVARRAVEYFLRTGSYPVPPASFDRNYDARGGVFVSFRERASDIRVARNGFWHFDSSHAEPGRDTVLAAIHTVRASGSVIQAGILGSLKIGVSFFGPLEAVQPAQLDFDTYGIVVRNKAGTKIGGALPNTQYFADELEQYALARSVNAGIATHEPHTLYRHRIEKWVEPGEYWLPFGSPRNPETDWTRSDEIGQRLTARARQFLHHLLGFDPHPSQPLPPDLIAAPVFGVGFLIFHRGLQGCGLGYGRSLDQSLRQAVVNALADYRRAVHGGGIDGRTAAFCVSIVHDREWIGEHPYARASAKMRLGIDAISVAEGNRKAMFLPFVPLLKGWSKEQAARELIARAGISQVDRCQWAIYPTASWFEWRGRVRRLRNCFPDRCDEPYGEGRWEADIKLLAGYISRQIGCNGLPNYCYDPATGEHLRTGVAARVIHALGALGLAGVAVGRSDWQDQSRKGLGYCLSCLRLAEPKDIILEIPGYTDAGLGAVLLAWLCPALGMGAPHSEKGRLLQGHLESLFRRDGRITDRPQARGLQVDHDTLPGVALRALAVCHDTLGMRLPNSLAKSRRWYQRRFDLVHPWTMVGWHGQGWGAMSAATADSLQTEFVMSMAQWALDFQHEKSGAFIDALSTDGFSFLTAFFAEGVAAAWAVAKRTRDARLGSFRASCQRSLCFMNRLIIRREDTFCMADPLRAIGGVRGAPHSTEVRIDYVSHTLMLLLTCQANATG